MTLLTYHCFYNYEWFLCILILGTKLELISDTFLDFVIIRKYSICLFPCWLFMVNSVAKQCNLTAIMNKHSMTIAECRLSRLSKMSFAVDFTCDIHPVSFLFIFQKNQNSFLMKNVVNCYFSPILKKMINI